MAIGMQQEDVARALDQLFEAGIVSKSVRVAQAEGPGAGVLGQTTTRELLEELRLRGDLAMTVMPSTERGADGAVLSALAGVQLKTHCLATLEAVRGS
jgi:hypothetical protein